MPEFQRRVPMRALPVFVATGLFIGAGIASAPAGHRGHPTEPIVWIDDIAGASVEREGRQFDPGLSPSQVIATLQNTGRPVATNGTATAVGGGYIDAAAALGSVKPVPAAPSVTGATSGNGQVTLTWTAARTNPAFPVTGYIVTPLISGVAQTPTTFNSTATAEVVTGLTNGTADTFTVRAFNMNGSGPPSAPTAATTIRAPGIPTSVSATPGDGQATVRWTAPVSNGLTITGYTVTPLVAGVAQTPRVFNSAATTEVITGLTNGTTFTFKVAARTAFAGGHKSTASRPIVVGALSSR